jgi:CheY-like chemotaxis protein
MRDAEALQTSHAVRLGSIHVGVEAVSSSGVGSSADLGPLRPVGFARASTGFCKGGGVDRINHTHVHGSAGRLLVIDDEESLLPFVREVGAIAGYAVEATASATYFLRCVREWHPTLIFLDLKMGDMDGVELMHALAAYKFSAPIVLMSGCETNVLRTVAELGRGLGLNMAGSLAKPIRLETFLRSLDEHASLRNPRG